MIKATKLTIVVFFLFIMQSQAINVIKSDATTVAHNFYYERNNQNSYLDYNSTLVGEVFELKIRSNTVIFVVNFIDGGWVAISGEYAVKPIIAYSFSGNYNPEFMPDNFKAWISQYKIQIYEVIQNGILPSSNVKEMWTHYLTKNQNNFLNYSESKNVEPLIVTSWDQGLYYNEMCPTDPGGPGNHCYTGCVPTCMGQICNYFRFPNTGIGSYSYDCPPYGELSVDFSEAIYNWNEMPVRLSTNNFETAQLLYHLGVSCDLVYGPDGSGMYNHKAAYALKTHFGYSPETQYLYRDSTNLNWDSVIIAHLDKKIPLYYAGWSVPNINGHAFVCDGYDGNGYFHFNWGWSGSNDGYFITENLNPGGSNFNLAQELIINCFPDTINHQYPKYCTGIDTINSMFGMIDDGSGPVYSYQNNQNCSWLISPLDSVNSISLEFLKFDIELADTLYIYDGNSTNSPLLGKYTGNSIPSDITSSGDEIYFSFISISNTTLDGWLISFTSEIPQYCSNETMVNATGTLSDGSGQANYHNSTTCLWMIQPTNGENINLEFSSFSTEQDYDIVTIFDGNIELGAFSGSEIPPILTATSGMMTIFFATNTSVTDKGWEASYSTSTVGFDNFMKKSELNIYPVPCNNSLVIELEVESTITIYNLVGDVVIQEYSSVEVKEINTAKLNNGMYILKVSNGNNTVSKKIIVKH